MRDQEEEVTPKIEDRSKVSNLHEEKKGEKRKGRGEEEEEEEEEEKEEEEQARPVEVLFDFCWRFHPPYKFSVNILKRFLMEKYFRFTQSFHLSSSLSTV